MPVEVIRLCTEAAGRHPAKVYGAHRRGHSLASCMSMLDARFDPFLRDKN